MEDILYRNALDVTTAAEKIQVMLNDLEQGVNKAAQIASGLEGCIVEDEDESNDGVLFRVGFHGDASISNVVDFKDWGHSWHEIGRGIAIAHGATPEDIKIVGATKGSVILELLVISGIAITFSSTICDILKVVEKVLELKIKCEELKQLRLQNQKIVEGISNISKEADNEKNREIEKIVEEHLEKLSLKKNNGEQTEALKKAIVKLADFLAKGGDIDLVIPTEESNEENETLADPDFAQLRNTSEKIRSLKQTIYLLENKADE